MFTTTECREYSPVADHGLHPWLFTFIPVGDGVSQAITLFEQRLPKPPHARTQNKPVLRKPGHSTPYLLFEDFPYVDPDWANAHATAAPDAEGTAQVVRPVVEFMHYALAHPLLLRAPRIVSGSVFGKQLELTRIPISDTAAKVPARFVLHIKAVAGWAKKRACAAADASLADPPPHIRIESVSKLLLLEYFPVIFVTDLRGRLFAHLSKSVFIFR